MPGAYRWRLWALASIIGVGGALAYLLLTPPVYRVRATVIYSESDAQPSQLAALMSQFGGLAGLQGLGTVPGGNEKSRALAVLASRKLARDFAVAEGLVPALFPDWWDSLQQSWRDAAPNDWQIADRIVRQVLKISTDPKTDVTTIVVTWPDAATAAGIANRYIRFANERLRSSVLRENEAALKFLESEMAKATTIELREAAARISEARLKALMLARISDDFAFRVIDDAVVPPKKGTARPSVAIAILLAAGLAVGAWAVLELLTRRLRESDHASTQRP